MARYKTFFPALLLSSCLALLACGEEARVSEQAVAPEPSGTVAAEEARAVAEATPATAALASVDDDVERLLVHKSETCGCCALWVDHLTEEGMQSEVQTEVDMEAVKTRLGVPERHRSCHTAISRDGYVFEGHVPALAIRRFMRNPPKGALGLAVPGMPIGSPGMEVDNQFQPYEIVLLMKDGSSRPYGYMSNYAAQFEGREAESAEQP